MRRLIQLQVIIHVLYFNISFAQILLQNYRKDNLFVPCFCSARRSNDKKTWIGTRKNKMVIDVEQVERSFVWETFEDGKPYLGTYKLEIPGARLLV